MFSIAEWSTLSNFNTYIVDPGCTVRFEVLWEPLVRVRCVLPTKPWSCGQPQQPSSAADIQFGHFITAAALISWPGYTWMVRSSAADNLPGGTGQQKIADRTTSEKPLSLIYFLSANLHLSTCLGQTFFSLIQVICQHSFSLFSAKLPLC